MSFEVYGQSGTYASPTIPPGFVGVQGATGIVYVPPEIARANNLPIIVPAGQGAPPSPTLTEAEIRQRYLAGEINEPQAIAAFKSLGWQDTQIQQVMNPLILQKNTQGAGQGATSGGGGAGVGNAPVPFDTTKSAQFDEEMTTLGPTFQRYLLDQNYRALSPLGQESLERQQGPMARQYILNQAASGQPTGFGEYLDAMKQGLNPAGGQAGLRNVQDIMRRYQGRDVTLSPLSVGIGGYASKQTEEGIPSNLLGLMQEVAKRRGAPALSGYLAPWLQSQAEDFFARGGPGGQSTPYGFTKAMQEWF